MPLSFQKTGQRQFGPAYQIIPATPAQDTTMLRPGSQQYIGLGAQAYESEHLLKWDLTLPGWGRSGLIYRLGLKRLPVHYLPIFSLSPGHRPLSHPICRILLQPWFFFNPPVLDYSCSRHPALQPTQQEPFKITNNTTAAIRPGKPLMAIFPATNTDSSKN